MKGKILIAFFVFVLLISIIPYDSMIVSASISVYKQGFEEQVLNEQINISKDPNNHLSSFKTGGYQFAVMTSRRSGYLGFTFTYQTGTGAGSGYFNFSYSKSSYMTNFSMWFNQNSVTYLSNPYFYFYNLTLGLSKPIITFIMLNTGVVSFCGHTIATGVHLSEWIPVFWNINNDIGICDFGYDEHRMTDTAYNCSAINLNYRIDRIYINTGSPVTTSTCGHYIDDLNYTMSSSYSGSTSPSGCNDYSSYQNIGNNMGNVNIHQDIDYPYIEFCSDNKYSLLGEGFELLVGSGQYDMDSDVNNYQLYINGNYIGLASCFYQYDSENYILQFDIPSLNTSDELIVIDLVHTVGSAGHYWNLALYDWGYGYIVAPPSKESLIKESSTSAYINTVLDGQHTLYYQPLWKLYYSSFTSSHEGELPFTNNIVLVGFQPNHPQYNIPYSYQYKTVFFDVYTDNANGYYNLSVMRGNTLSGTDQYYPIKIYDYKKQYGFTPYTIGNYTVNLSHGTTQILHEHFNITTTTDTYSIWSFPNPSNPSSTYKIGVFLKYTSGYTDYFICGWGNPDDVNSVNSSSEKIKVGNLTNNMFYATVDHLSNYIDYWRLFGTNDEIFFTPLTPVEKHYIYTTVENYIRTSLTDGKGLLDTEFNIYGSCDSYASIVKVFKGTQAIYDVTMGSFIFPLTEHKTGTYKYDLKISTDTGWIILDSVTVSISEKKTSPEVGLILLPPPYSYIMGAIITIALMILPSVGLGKIGMSESESLKYVPIFSGTMGFILSCLIGLFPWYSIFALLFVLILIIVVLYLSKNKQ